MRIITEEEVKSKYSMKQCIESVEQALRIQQNKSVQTPLRTSIELKNYNGTMLYMPSYSEDIGYSGVKIVSIHPNNNLENRKTLQSVLVLTDAKSGEHIALLDASLLTVMRTGSLSGVASKYLAKENSESCLIIGCGEQARGQISAILEVRDLSLIMLYNRTLEKVKQFEEYLRNDLSWNGEIQVLENPDEGVPQADIIVCATNSTTPIFDGTQLKPGTHINGIGSYQHHMQEVDVNTLKKCNRIVVDTMEGVLEEAGDFIIPMASNDFSIGEIYAELGEIVIGKKKGRETNDEISFFKSVGFSILDLVVAVSIYESITKKETVY
ncbi:ornithine cyclodeaminase family protein [Cytobacillus sp. FJAT-53684]|uniref:Ornithine cyclodeaminase family protein n=1 Tax=Cytobacillus mangrovibacter TaxID=3299024 RepID=A0ABW6K2N2_9BACI